MKRGRRPTPTSLKLLAGNPGKRPINQNEPKPTPAIPSCPKHLDPIARREWRRIARELAIVGLISNLDRSALAAYCDAFSRWVRASEQIREYGMVLRSPNGYPIVSPYVSVLNKSLEQMRVFLTEFGMTPASRTRLEVQLEDFDDEEDRKFFGPQR